MSHGPNRCQGRWFNTDAGFEKDPAKAPASFQKRQFPFRIEGVRGPDLKMLSLNVMRTFSLGGRRTAVPRRHHQRVVLNVQR